MTVFTEGFHTAEFMVSEANGFRSRDAIVILSGEGKLAAGTVLSKIAAGAATAAAKSGGNTGNGTISAVTTAAGVKVGIYTVRFTAATAFVVEDPDGYSLGAGATGTAWADDLGFTITAGGTPFVAGDGFDITVAAGSGKYRAAQNADVGNAILWAAVDATSADAPGAAVTRSAEVNAAHLVYHSSVDDAGKKSAKAVQLAAVGIIVR
jgi:hypothetical protein